MSYREEGRVFRHPDRRVIFVGDFIDRGPQQMDVLNIAKGMCEAGTVLAVIGDHEFNALGWATPDGNGGFLRPHSLQNHGQHKEFLRQVGEGTKVPASPDWLHEIKFDGYRLHGPLAIWSKA